MLPETITLYHGAKAPFACFAPPSEGGGCEPNCELGIFLTADPAYAAAYTVGGADPCVLTVEVQTRNTARATSAFDVSGIAGHAPKGHPARRHNEHEFLLTHEHFRTRRQEILRQGIELIACDIRPTGRLNQDHYFGGSLWIALDPAICRIVKASSRRSWKRLRETVIPKSAIKALGAIEIAEHYDLPPAPPRKRAARRSGREPVYATVFRVWRGTAITDLSAALDAACDGFVTWRNRSILDEAQDLRTTITLPEGPARRDRAEFGIRLKDTTSPQEARRELDKIAIAHAAWAKTHESCANTNSTAG